MFDLMVDIYELVETTLNGEPVLAPDSTPITTDLPAQFLRLTGGTRYLAAGVGVVISARMAIPATAGVTEKCQVQNIRTREGDTVLGPAGYRILFVDEGRRHQHMELDLEALRGTSGD